MAGFLGGQEQQAGGLGASPPGGNLTGQTYFGDPQIAQRLLQALSQPAQGAASQFGDFIQNPTASPLFQNQLQGLLQALAPSENRAQTNLADVFRGVGNMSSGVYGNAATNLQGDILRNRQTLASDLLGKSFNSISQSLLQAMQQGGNLLNASKLSQNYGQPSSGFSYVGGGGGGMGDPQGTGLSYADIQARLSGYNSAAEQLAAQMGIGGNGLQTGGSSVGGAASGPTGATGFGASQPQQQQQPYDWAGASGQYFNPGQQPNTQDLMGYYDTFGWDSPSIAPQGTWPNDMNWSGLFGE